MDEKGFVEGMREYIAQLNREKRYSSAKSYQDALNSFIRYSGTDCIAYSAINKDNLRRYEAYLLENGCMRNTISTYMRRLRCIYNKAVENGKVNYVDRVSCKEIICYLPDGTSQTCSLSEAPNFQFSIFNSQLLKCVVLLDCGVKHNIIRCLLRRNVAVIRVPWDYDFNQLEYDGLFISNGPGDPDTCDAAVRNIRKALSGDKPICGICMGNQLLAKAAWCFYL